MQNVYTLLADLPALVTAPGGAVVVQHGQSARLKLEEAKRLFRSGDVLVAHTGFVAGRLKTAPAAPLYDLMEFYAFVRPAQPCAPSPVVLARALGLPQPQTPEEQATALGLAAQSLLGELLGAADKERLRPIAWSLMQAGWKWAPLVLAIIGEPEKKLGPLAGYDTWRELPKWEDDMAPARPGSLPVNEQEVGARLSLLLGPNREQRKEQSEYAAAASYAFGARTVIGAPKIAMLEAGTGTGKTLGYLAPASLWAEKNGPGVWVSTYTRNLQRQIVQEAARLYPDPIERDEKVVVRKGRENYLCLLNFEEAARRVALAPGQRAVALGLVARWIAATADGDISGQNFPAFLAASFPLSEITDRRGECIYAACPHYRSCFIERAIRRARYAPIVIANHALVIAQVSGDALFLDENGDAPPERRARYVFDEGHHLFDAADSGFSALLSGQEMADLRRWIRGPEGRARSRMRGLEERLRDIIGDDDTAILALEEAVQVAGALAGEGWLTRIHNGNPRGAGEFFLSEAYRHVRARSDDGDARYSLEAAIEPLDDDLLNATRDLSRALHRLTIPLLNLSQILRKQLDEEAGRLETFQRARIEAAMRGLARRGRIVLPNWISMLDALDGNSAGEEFVDWFEIAREDGRDLDVGLHRHWVDPTVPLATEILARAHGALITSATLRDGSDGLEEWESAEIRTGVLHLPEPPKRASFGSPFRYSEQSRVFIVRDVNRRDADQLASAYRELFLAAGGGGLGLFTAVHTLRAVESRIAQPLSDEGITLYAQHVDRLDTGALIDLFRAEENACLLGTDALRDGVDVPGRSLRLVVFDKVPWPKPTILHKARRARFGKRYDDLLTRLRLKQAFGRLIRTTNDKGCFVLLEPATPSRLLSAFPHDTPIRRCGLKEAIFEIREFLGSGA